MRRERRIKEELDRTELERQHETASEYEGSSRRSSIRHRLPRKEGKTYSRTHADDEFTDGNNKGTSVRNDDFEN
tara:strand:+ start:169 stop:390 length:222 start_codon:yes stop_codon:yes gene_type:complete